jgi:hypothetical protein
MPRFILTRANYLTVAHFECKPLALALPENIGLACTSLLVTNTLAYLRKKSILTFTSKVFVQIGSKITSYHPFIIFKEKFFS